MKYKKIVDRITKLIDEEKEEMINRVKNMSEEERKKLLKDEYGLTRKKWLDFEHVKKVIEIDAERRKKIALMLVENIEKKELKKNYRFLVRIKHRKGKHGVNHIAETHDGDYSKRYSDKIVALIEVLNRNDYILKSLYNYIENSDDSMVTGIPPKISMYISEDSLMKLMKKLGWKVEVLTWDDMDDDIYVFAYKG